MLLIVVLHILQMKDPMISSGLTSLQRVTVPGIEISFPISHVLKSLKLKLSHINLTLQFLLRNIVEIDVETSLVRPFIEHLLH